MKKILLYIFAIPIGIIASVVLPALYSNILKRFIPFDSINYFLENYFLTFASGWIAIGVTALIAPSKKILFGGIALALNVFASIYMYYLGDSLNYLFIVGGSLSLVFVISNYKNENLSLSD